MAASTRFCESRCNRIEGATMYPKPEFYHPSEVREMLQVSEETLWRMRRQLDFPDPVNLTKQKVVYRAHEVHDWLGRRLGLESPMAA